MTPDFQPPPVTLADRYRLHEVMGRGAMGEVWSATDLRLQRPVAVKVLSEEMASEAGVRERFEVEARSAARLTHPNVVLVYDSGEQDGVPFLVMELLAGRTLADDLALGTIDPLRARRIGIEVLSALDASHEVGILHRDIKPGNVLLTAEGTAKVGDFGIAKSTEGLNLTSTGLIVGTAAYLAPERVTGQGASPQSDIYAVGVLLYEALSGRQPFRADTPIGVMEAIEASDVPPLSRVCPGLDSDLVAAVERAMAKDPSRRFARAADMAAALQVPPGAPAPAPDDPTLLDAQPLAASPGAGAAPPTQVLRVAGTGAAALGSPRGRRRPAHPASALRSSPRVLAVAAVAALSLLIVLLGTRSSSGPPTATTPTTTPASTLSPTVAADRDRAARRNATTATSAITATSVTPAPPPSVTDPTTPSQGSGEDEGDGKNKDKDKN